MPLTPEKLSTQPAAQVGTESDYGMVVQDGQTRRQTRTQLRTAILSAWQGFIGTFLAAGSTAAARTAIGAIGSADNITGSAAKLTTARTISATGDATWSASFDGSANATSALTLSSTGTAGTYGSVTTDAKGRVTSGTVATPIANGGTAATTALAAGTNLGTSTVGTNTDQLARSSMIQNEIANKRAWTSYTPTITPLTGSYTSAAATGTYMTVFGICHFRIQLTVTTKGTGANPTLSLPVAALAGHINDLMLAREVAITGTMGVARINNALTGVSISSYNAVDLVTADGCIVVITGYYPIA
jgi:phage-related tail fiber protein